MRSARAGFGSLLPADFDWSAFADGGERIVERIEQPDVRVALGEDDGGPAGYCIVGPSRDGDAEGEVWTLFVDPGTWGAGLSDALIEDGLAWLAAAGFGSVTVWSFVDNRRANRFYERYGFRDGACVGRCPSLPGWWWRDWRGH